MPKKGITLGGTDLTRGANMTQIITKSATKLDNIDECVNQEAPMQSEKASLVDNIREGNLRNARP